MESIKLIGAILAIVLSINTVLGLFFAPDKSNYYNATLWIVDRLTAKFCPENENRYATIREKNGFPG